ncbi:peptidylprolyl isomerase [Novosphingobium sp.]|uniref:peptidylprolyl isomerase n=1 Tax=Novosphingobium sp. TaxID=1874826 RepID=UPI0022C7BD69|nr:peptidylprolyl isomerase [Novosphingobium sp.]MCZ8018573.1 peptidylprolyl isomerase [Novosphingobium sp.]MCZ8036034.1 peptidylprolyl isomerase [Novosphingobium sp.]MCZ8050322.1 peptidylprolyl isomerase [Novosphingobium sp.]MCZ8060911.1 peptidylprolyl isomerase [Novosphingobium sp.]MCZ8233158.1 peptidylprolyl isomerase [Novosphingobium sp.]
MAKLKAAAEWALHEPLMRFLVIGAVLFAGISLVRAEQRPTITIDAAEIEQLVSYWRQQSHREPDREELKAIINERVDEEVLAEEAKRLGLDSDDMIIRRRLAQKMAFASEDTVEIPEPSEAELAAYYQANQARYAAPERVALRHVFFSDDRTETSPPVAASDALRVLRAGGRATGDPSMLPLSYADVTIETLERDYGEAFAKAVAAAPVGQWTGPVESGFGLHLIRVESRQGRKVPPLADVRDEVRIAWIEERRAVALREQLAELRRGYRIEVAGLPK